MRTPDTRSIALAMTTVTLASGLAMQKAPAAEAAKPPTRLERQTQETTQYLSARILSLFKHERGIRYRASLGRHIVAKGVRFEGVTSLIGPESTGNYAFNVQSRNGHARDPEQIDLSVKTGDENLAAITYVKQGRGWIMGANIATKGGSYSFTIGTNPALGSPRSTRQRALALDELSNQILNAAVNNGHAPRPIGLITIPQELTGLGPTSSPSPDPSPPSYLGLAA